MRSITYPRCSPRAVLWQWTPILHPRNISAYLIRQLPSFTIFFQYPLILAVPSNNFLILQNTSLIIFKRPSTPSLQIVPNCSGCGYVSMFTTNMSDRLSSKHYIGYCNVGLLFVVKRLVSGVIGILFWCPSIIQYWQQNFSIICHFIDYFCYNYVNVWVRLCMFIIISHNNITWLDSFIEILYVDSWFSRITHKVDF